VVLNPGQDTSYVSTPFISPNAKWVGFSRDSADGDQGPFVVDVSGSTPGAPRRLLNANTGYVSGGSFSPDSSRVAFMHYFQSLLAYSLYVGDVVHPTALARLVFQGECPGSGTGSSECHDVHSFQFQP
jgi:Tol biopolymer transport system component